jgi:hypothetical protein
MLSMKGIGQAAIFMGALIGLDSAGMGGIHGTAGALVGVLMMSAGILLIRRSKSKPKS